MKRLRMHEAFHELKKWIHAKYLSRSIFLKPINDISAKARPDFSSNHHLTPKKIAKWMAGLFPVVYVSYSLAYDLSQKVPVDQITFEFKSEDQIFSFLAKAKPVVTFMYLPGDVYSEVTHPHFHKIAEEFHDTIGFAKVNCAVNSAYCRSRKLKDFPTVEIYLPPPPPDASFETKTRFRLLKETGDFAISPFKSDLSYEGFKGALQELKLVPCPEPFKSTKEYYYERFSSDLGLQN